MILQILSGENHLNDVISWGIGKLYRKTVVLGNMLIACEMMYTCEMYLTFENLTISAKFRLTDHCKHEQKVLIITNSLSTD